MKLRALIVDDEIHARENLKYLLTNYCPEIEIVGTASNVENAIEAINTLAPQLIFLDICMPSGTEGFDLLDALPEKKFQVVFVTAFSAHAIRALNANAIHYLMKPVDADELKVAVNKVLTVQQLFHDHQEQRLHYIRSLDNLNHSVSAQTGSSTITIHHAQGFKIVDPTHFMYLEEDGTGSCIFFADGTHYPDIKSISVFEDVLNKAIFIRINKSHLVNVRYVKEFINTDGHFVIMQNDAKLPISRLRIPMVTSLFKGK